jgi:Flp pilus assembly protein TadD
MKMRRGIRSVLAASVLVAAACGARRGNDPAPPPAVSKPGPPPSALADLVNDSPLAPSFIKVDPAGGPVDVTKLVEPTLCSECHADVVAQWEPSVHHNSSFADRFYATAVALTRTDRGNKAGRWCAGCHEPSLLLDVEEVPDGHGGKELESVVDKPAVSKHPRAADGLGCLSCHSITGNSRQGGGGYTLTWQPFVKPDVTDDAQVQDHKRRMQAPAMSDAELCGNCHKVALVAAVNGKRWLRGQNEFDPWEQGPYALGGKQAAGEIYAPDVEKQRCQECHMPHEEISKGDLAGKKVAGQGDKKFVRSHRFLAANTALAALSGDADTIERQRKRLAGAVRVDVMAIRRERVVGKADLVEDAKLDPKAVTDPFLLDVVVVNENVGHRFPSGTVDSNEVWLALDVIDANGKKVAQSGALDAKGALDPDAHKFGVLQLDGEGKAVTKRDAHRFVTSGWDTTIAPKDARVVRFRITPPPGTALPLKVTAKVEYRKFAREYTLLACNTTEAFLPPLAKCPELPIVEVARDEAVIGAPRTTTVETWRRLDAYGRGLLNALQEDAGDAGPILERVIALRGDRAEGHVDLARMLILQGRIVDANAELDRAAALDPTTPVVPYLRGVAMYQIYRLGEVTAPLRLAASRAPRSVSARELLAESLELAGDDRAALDVTHEGLRIDPESAQLRHLEALAYDRLGLPKDADIARAAYLKYRVDDDRPRLRSICKATIPGCAREAVPLHVHDAVAAR